MGQGPRRKVFNDPGHAHELTFSTHRRMRLLDDLRFCRIFLDNLDRSRRDMGFQVWAYVLMPDHVHLLVFPARPGYDMADVRQSVKQPVSHAALALMRAEGDPRVARLHDGRKSRFWQPGGRYDRNLHSAAACKKSIDYIHNNPVVAGLCAHPCDYEWSSAAWYQGLLPVPFKVDRAVY